MHIIESRDWIPKGDGTLSTTLIKQWVAYPASMRQTRRLGQQESIIAGPRYAPVLAGREGRQQPHISTEMLQVYRDNYRYETSET